MVSKQEWYTIGDDANQGFDGSDEAAQTFTLGTTGDNITFNITSVDIKLTKTGSPTGTMDIEIQNVKPDGSTLRS